MRKIAVILTAICLFSNIVLAEETRGSRIEALIQETQKVDQMILQYESEVKRLTQIKMENIGRIKELQRQEDEAKKTEKKKGNDDKKNR